ncbi:MAG: HlyD family efflux transporter periplasmic adaptor subunit [Cyanobacteriota bacterium]|nr:HlyD family efflux transporter periplasmic adaptor subunit [Cyanobacteriota bacterium]
MNLNTNINTLSDRAASESLPRRSLILAGVAILGLVGTTAWGVGQLWVPARDSQTEVEIAPEIPTVTALGRLEPEGEIIDLTAPTATQSNRMEELLVEEGDRVSAGQVIAVLDGGDRLEAALERAEEDVRVARARLAQVEAGAKSGDIAAQAAQIERVRAQWQGEEAAQEATLDRIQAQWDAERAAQEATLDRIQAQIEGERNAQIATLDRLNAQLKNAEAEYQRNRQLYEDGAISLSLFDSKRLDLETSRQQVIEAQANLERIERTGTEQIAEAQANLARIDGTLGEQLVEARANLDRIQLTGIEQVNEATSQLDSIAEVRPVDVQVTQAEVDRAIAAVTQAIADLDQISVKAPQSGQIVEIHTRPGEQIADRGIATLGQTQQMMAIAEVYQDDVAKIKVGQTAIVTSPAIPDTLNGTVEQIGLQVEQQQVVDDDPSANIDARVVEVRVRLDRESSEKVAGFTNLQVTVTVEI